MAPFDRSCCASFEGFVHLSGVTCLGLFLISVFVQVNRKTKWRQQDFYKSPKKNCGIFGSSKKKVNRCRHTFFYHLRRSKNLHCKLFGALAPPGRKRLGELKQSLVTLVIIGKRIESCEFQCESSDWYLEFNVKITKSTLLSQIIQNPCHLMCSLTMKHKKIRLVETSRQPSEIFASKAFLHSWLARLSLDPWTFITARGHVLFLALEYFFSLFPETPRWFFFVDIGVFPYNFLGDTMWIHLEWSWQNFPFRVRFVADLLPQRFSLRMCWIQMTQYVFFLWPKMR